MTVIELDVMAYAPYSKNIALALVPPITVTSVALIVVITKVPREHVLYHLPCYIATNIYVEKY